MRYSPPTLPVTTRIAAPAASYEVRGKDASSYEYNFAQALEYYRLDYLFQVDYWGGRRFRGGIVLDFLVFTVPQYTPVWINGEYWHQSGKQRDVDYLQQVLFNSVFRGLLRPPLILWGKDVDTFEAAKSTVRRHL